MGVLPSLFSVVADFGGSACARVRCAALRKCGTIALRLLPVQSLCRRSVFAILALAISLCSCSGAGLIDRYTRDYRDTTASVADAQLLLNILRARDDLPIHFADLSVITGSIQWTAGATAAIPLAQNGSTTPTTISPSIGAQNTPTFDLGSLDTQDFTRGMLSPVDAQLIKQLFDQGIDPRLLMILFFSEYRDPWGRVYQNNLSCEPERGLNDAGECYNRIYDFLDKIDAIFREKGLAPTFTKHVNTPPDGEQYISEKVQHLYANVYLALRPVGGELSGAWSLKDNLDQLRQLDLTKYRLLDRHEALAAGARWDEADPSYKHLYSVSEPRIAICYEKHNYLSLLFPSRAGDRACRNREVIVHESPSEAGSFGIRSTYQIIQFLGQVLRFQEEKRTNRCLTLSADAHTDNWKRHCDTGEVVFQVNSPVGTPVVATRYADATYTVDYRACNKEHDQPCDYSLQVLAILELILNYNKAAKDILAIPRVQTVP
jgi:hypothetical protein